MTPPPAPANEVEEIEAVEDVEDVEDVVVHDESAGGATSDATPGAPEPATAATAESQPGPAPTSLPEGAPTVQTETAPPPPAVAGGAVAGSAVPGAYLPPSTVHRAGTSPASWAPPGPPGPPGSPPATGAWVPPAPTPVVAAQSAAPAPAAAPGGTQRDARPPVPGRASILADLPFDAPDQLEGWLVALGGGLGIIGFFLPWTASLGTGLEGYFGSWGLGIVSHLPVFAFLVIITALALLPNRVATWVRSGVCGMVGGGVLFGIVWLYLGSDASQLGALLSAVAAVLLVVGGIIAVAPGRAERRGEDA